MHHPSHELCHFPIEPHQPLKLKTDASVRVGLCGTRAVPMSQYSLPHIIFVLDMVPRESLLLVSVASWLLIGAGGLKHLNTLKPTTNPAVKLGLSDTMGAPRIG